MAFHPTSTGDALMSATNVLDRIVAHKRAEIDAAKQAVPAERLTQQLTGVSPPRDFCQALRQAEPIGLIAEIKKASPSAGLIREDFDPVEIARIYESHGAACISVLTDEHFFSGRLSYLTQVREAVSLPCLRKDFILDPYQVIEARAAGADAVLLIAECLEQPLLEQLFESITSLGMTPLVELYDPENLDRVLSLNPPLVGINNRNLKTFVTDLRHTLDLRDRIPADCLLVSESGIHTHSDVTRLIDAGVQAMLIGESLMRAPDIGVQVDTLLGR